MIEPVLGEGGAKSISKEFFKKAQELANNNNCLVISDEVQTGIGRLGTLFGYEKTDLKPDIMAIAKGLGGGVPIGAVLASKKVASAMKPGSHGSTFGKSSGYCLCKCCPRYSCRKRFLKNPWT